MSIYFNLGIWWIGFFAVHSIMASTLLKKKVDALHPVLKSYYRIFFNLISAALLFPIVNVFSHLPLEYIFIATTYYQVVGIILSLAGFYIIIDSFKNYNIGEFIGTFQLKNHHEFHPSQLIRSGWNGIVRHPLYFGGILLAIGMFIISPTIKLGLTNLLIFCYLYIGTIWEEKKLILEFGDDYRRYKAEVSMLLPIKWMISKIRNK